MPNPKSDFIERQKKICREEWFKEHKANLIGGKGVFPDVTGIGWENPKSWNYGCRFIIHRRWLCVVGDIGEAVYEWGQDLTLEFLSGLDLDYFLGKCRASEEGYPYTAWNSRFAFDGVQEFLAKEDAENYPGENDDYRQHLRLITAGMARDEFEQNCREAYHHKHSGLDPEVISGLIDNGIVDHPRAIGHFIGLQMAIEQLTKK